MFSTKVSLLYLLYSTARRYCLLHLIRENCLLKAFLRTLILMSQLFLSRTNLNRHNIYVSPRMIKTFIANTDSSEAFGLDCIPEVVLKNIEPEISYILQSKLYKATTVGTTQKWSSYAGGHLKRHHYKRTTNQMLLFLGGFLCCFFFPRQCLLK